MMKFEEREQLLSNRVELLEKRIRLATDLMDCICECGKVNPELSFSLVAIVSKYLKEE